MSNRVQMLPSGREFVCRGHSTLLEAGLGAGLALGYGCSNGNCGECLARLVSGEVEQTRHHDYVTRKGAGARQILMCCNTAVSDVVLEASEAQGSNEIPLQHITARVKSVQFTDANVALVHLKTPRSQRLRFLAGQHVQLGVSDSLSAVYPVASCPCDDMNLHFQIPRISGDPFSEHVFSSMRKGSAVAIEGPHGDFVLDEQSTRPLVFVAWQTGFGPIRSLVEHAMALDVTQDIHLAWVSGNSQDRYLDNLCRSWADALTGFNYTGIDSPPDEAAAAIAAHLFDPLKLTAEGLSGRDFYIAANQAILDFCRSFLLENGTPAAQLVLDQLVYPY